MSSRVQPINSPETSISSEPSFYPPSNGRLSPSSSTRNTFTPISSESKRVGLTSFSMPSHNPQASLKNRMAAIEESFDLQVQTNSSVDSQLADILNAANDRNASNAIDFNNMKNSFEDSLAWMKKEFNHKY